MPTNPRRSATATYQLFLADLARRLGSRLSAAWLRLPGAGRSASVVWLDFAVPLVLGAQMRAVSATDAYVAAYLTATLGRPVEPAGINPASLIGVAARRGTPLESVYNRPLAQVRHDVLAGVGLRDSLARAQWRIVESSATDVQLAARAARAATAESANQITGWRRVVSGGCALCVAAGGKIYRSGDLMPIHPGCDCGAEPIVGGSAPGKFTGTKTARVVDHGELGPLLVAADHTFSRDG